MTPRLDRRDADRDPQKVAARLAYSNRQLRRRIAELERVACGEAQRRAEHHTPNEGDTADGLDRFRR